MYWVPLCIGVYVLIALPLLFMITKGHMDLLGCVLALGLAVVLPSSILGNLPSSLVTLDTSLGQVSGVRKPAGNNTYVDVFYSIPFAQPPLGELRFKSPVPADPWNGVLDGTKMPDACWQALDTAFDRFWGVEMWNPNTPRSEDCLYLNVYLPNRGKSSAPSKPKPIMIWIYGGGFWAGSATLGVYDATYLAARNDVIVVSIAYRIGPLGFLYLGNDDVPGNAGLFDQGMAMKWVRDNAERLGGSPDDITLFGESAGAVSVGLHMFSPETRDLFSYAIMESSAPIANWAVQANDKAKARSLGLAASVSCDGKASEDELMQCLRKADPEVLSNNQWDFVEKYFDTTFAPVVDGKFIPDHPVSMLARGDIKRTSVILGMNKNEGIYFDLYGFIKDFPLEGNGQIDQIQFDNILPKIVDDPNKIQQVKNEYFKDLSLSYAEIVDAVSGDVLFKCPLIDFGQAYSNLGGEVYMYSFEHRVADNPWPEWFGVAHGYEIEIVFGLPLAPNSLSPSDEKTLSVEVMKLWTTFARTGNPNGAVEVWPRYDEAEEKYLVLDTSSNVVKEGLRRDQCAFWASLEAAGQE
ncbi:acetylcholinesterase [Aplysia californica]|uniref:Acetylcholinesterase n=1 Tax=Aplysia californica TaxID=6500 RepID=A0ABM0JM33_APLCA|nr:acetylcholinesterase [Aplysia californica]